MDHTHEPARKVTGGLIAVIALSLMYTLKNVYAFFAALIFWWVVLFFTAKRKKTTWLSMGLVYLTSIAFVVLLSLIERPWIAWIVVGVSFFVFLTLDHWIHVKQAKHFHVNFKPLRRIVAVIASFDLYVILTAFFALITFFQRSPFWLISILGAAAGALSAVTIWEMYYEKGYKAWSVWAGVVALITLELLWVVRTLPFGYFVQGLIVSWVWYLCTLFIRFHVSSRGIIWKKQKWFLAGNVICMIALLAFVRWI